MAFSLMGSLVMLVALMTAFIVVRAFVRVDAPAGLAFALRAGLVLMVVSQLVGVQMVVEGQQLRRRGRTEGSPRRHTPRGPGPARTGPRAVDVRGGRAAPPQDRGARRRGYATLIASTMVQRYAGRGPLDLGLASSVLALAGVALLVTSAVIALRGLGSRLHPPAAPSPLSP